MNPSNIVNSNNTLTRRSFLKGITVGAALALSGGTAYAYCSKDLEVSHKRLRLQGVKHRIRIVAVSDLHMPCFYSSTPDLVNAANATMPDIFILAGDTIDKRGNEALVRGFEKVTANLAKLAVLGNWEYQGQVDLKRLRLQYEKAGFSLMVNQTIGTAGVRIIGFDDFVYGSPDYNSLNQQQASSTPLVVLSHCPASFDRIAQSSGCPTIVLSGHTHGGQIAPFGFVLHTPKGSGSYVHGWYHKGKHSMYVMRGIGTSGIALRIGARPELLVLDIVGNASS